MSRLTGSSCALLFTLMMAATLLDGHGVRCRVFERCELAHELLKLKIARHDLATYLCIAEGESKYDSAAINRVNVDGSSDHGLFQVNDRYWCEAPNSSNGCKIACDKLRDDDISDDVKCVLHIQSVHGFSAWVIYKRNCVGRDLAHFIAGCQL